jgi:hypothetical protein
MGFACIGSKQIRGVMAYQGHLWLCANIADFWTAFQAFMENVGWEIHDAVSANEIVWKSNGESGTLPTCYLYVLKGTDLKLRCYLYWNATTHVGTVVTPASGSDGINAPTTAYHSLLAGNKDWIVAGNRLDQAGQPYVTMRGQFPNIVDTTKTTTTGDITTGSNVSIPVVSSAGFGIGTYATILGINYEGRDRIQITDIPDSTHIKVATVARNYATGAVIGRIVSTAGWRSSSGWYPLVYYTDAGVTNPVNYYNLATMLLTAVNIHTGLYALSPELMSYSGFSIAFSGPDGPFASSLTNNSIAYVQADRGIPPVSSVSSASNTTLVDSTKSWMADALIGKFVVITNGLGVNQVRKISDNDGTTLTVDAAWQTNPNVTSEYKVVDSVYPVTGCGTVKILETTAPA